MTLLISSHTHFETVKIKLLIFRRRNECKLKFVFLPVWDVVNNRIQLYTERKQSLIKGETAIASCVNFRSTKARASVFEHLIAWYFSWDSLNAQLCMAHRSEENSSNIIESLKPIKKI